MVHVVEAVSEFDEQDARSLAIATSILRIVAAVALRGSRTDPLELRDAVDDGGHLAAELALDIRERERVSRRVVQQAATTVMSSRPRSAMILATLSGWLM